MPVAFLTWSFFIRMYTIVIVLFNIMSDKWLEVRTGLGLVCFSIAERQDLVPI